MSFNFWNLGFTRFLLWNVQEENLKVNSTPGAGLGKAAKCFALTIMFFMVVLFVLIEKELSATAPKDHKAKALPDPGLLSLQENERVQLTYHVVQKGDSMPKIAQKYYGEKGLWGKILEANSQVLKSPRHLRVGMRLYIPPKDPLKLWKR